MNSEVKRKTILVANDDGIFAGGIKALALAMKPLGDVYVVAPEMEQSGVGHGITFRRPLRFKHTESAGFGDPDEFEAYREVGYNIGLDYVESGPLVRSSYHSEKHVIKGWGRAKWESEKMGVI